MYTYIFIHIYTGWKSYQKNPTKICGRNYEFGRNSIFSFNETPKKVTSFHMIDRALDYFK